MDIHIVGKKLFDSHVEIHLLHYQIVVFLIAFLRDISFNMQENSGRYSNNMLFRVTGAVEKLWLCSTW
jgi:hypothetical protein